RILVVGVACALVADGIAGQKPPPLQNAAASRRPRLASAADTNDAREPTGCARRPAAGAGGVPRLRSTSAEPGNADPARPGPHRRVERDGGRFGPPALTDRGYEEQRPVIDDEEELPPDDGTTETEV